MRVDLEHLALRYRDRAALDDVSASLEGRVLGLLGANGSGKTSLLTVLAGIAAATEGRARIDGDELRPGRRPGVAYLPQEVAFFPYWQPPSETLSASLLLRGIKDYDPQTFLAALGLEDEDRSAGEFSGGMKQKLRIAQALAHSPRLLLLDEPTTGLDLRERFRILRMMERLAGRTSVVFSTHQPEDAAAVADQVLILHRGRAVASGRPATVKELARDRVFQVSASLATLPVYPDAEIVAVDRDDEQLHVRVVGRCPPGGVSVPPRLEDAYILLTHHPRG